MSSLYKHPPITIRPAHERFTWYQNIKWRGRAVTDRQGVAGQRKETSVFANPFPSEISIRAKRQGLVKRKKNSKALLGSRRLPLEFLSILHPWPFSQAKLSFRRLPTTIPLSPFPPHLQFSFSLQPPSRLPPLSFFLRVSFSAVVFLAPLETRSTVLVALISLMQVRAVRRSFR